MSKVPEILETQVIACTALFQVESVALRFQNGETRCFERITGTRGGSVMVVPMDSHQNLYLVREYAVGSHRYELGFPKGVIEPNEPLLDAANRELQEEIGMGAKTFTEMKPVSTAPGYVTANMQLLLATELYTSKREGDEPEPLEIEVWPLKDYQQLLLRDDFSEARSIAALLLLKERML